MGGLRYVTGEADRAPSRSGISIGDSLAATYAAFGTLAALHAREHTGRGQVVDSAIYEAVLAMMESLIPEWSVADYRRERTGPILPNRTLPDRPAARWHCTHTLLDRPAARYGCYRTLPDHPAARWHCTHTLLDRPAARYGCYRTLPDHPAAREGCFRAALAFLACRPRHGKPL